MEYPWDWVSSAFLNPDTALNRGAGGEVHKLVHPQTRLAVAVKRFDRGPLAQDPRRNHSFEKEVTLFSKLEHPNVVRLLGIKTERDCHLLIMELADGDLLGEVSAAPLPEAEARAYFRQVVSAVRHCHAMQICHRDLKLENVVIMQDGITVKVTDFGLGKDFGCYSCPKTHSIGTFSYMAPEMLSGMDSYEGGPVDVWALGVMVYVLCVRRFPFGSISSARNTRAQEEEIRRRIMNANEVVRSPGFFPGEEWFGAGHPGVSPELQSLIRQILVVEPGQRITIDALASHPWMQGADPDYFQPQQAEQQPPMSMDSLDPGAPGGGGRVGAAVPVPVPVPVPQVAQWQQPASIPDGTFDQSHYHAGAEAGVSAEPEDTFDDDMEDDGFY